MPRRLSWLPQALTDLIRLREFIHVHNPAAASRAAQRIRGNCQNICRINVNL